MTWRVWQEPCHADPANSAAERAQIDAGSTLGGGRRLAGLLAGRGDDGLVPARQRRTTRDACVDAEHCFGALVVALPLGQAIGAAVDAARDRDELARVGQL